MRRRFALPECLVSATVYGGSSRFVFRNLPNVSILFLNITTKYTVLWLVEQELDTHFNEHIREFNKVQLAYVKNLGSDDSYCSIAFNHVVDFKSYLFLGHNT